MNRKQTSSSLAVAALLVAGVPTALTFGAPSLFAQATSGDLVGTVRDASGASVPKAEVTVVNEGTGVTNKVTTNAEGQYRVSNLLAGTYDISALSSGFAATKITGVSITLNKTSTTDVVLSVSSSTSVEVTASSGVTLDTTTNNLTTNFESQELAVLPTATTGFGVLNASLLAPNVTSPGGTGVGTGPSIGGQRPRNNNYTVEGIDDNDKSVTGPLVTIPNDAVGDFTLITSQFSPEFGHSSGGQFNTNVISGTNHIHGRVYEYFQNRNLNAASGPAGGKVPNPRYDNNRYGGQIGGPIIKNKLFAFGNFERNSVGQSLSAYICTPTAAGRSQLQGLGATYGLRSANLAQYLLYAPTANVGGGAQVSSTGVGGPLDQGCFDTSGLQTLSVSTDGAGTGAVNIPLGNAFVSPPVYTNSDQTTISVDFTPSQKDNFRFRYSYFTQGSIDTTNDLSPFFTTLPLKEHLGAFSWFHNFTPNFINELRVGYNRMASNTPATTLQYPGLNQFPNLIFFDAGIDIGGDDNAPQFGVQNLYQLVDNVSYIRGRHTLKFGFDGRKYISPQNFVQRQRGDYEWTQLDYFLHDLAPDSDGFGERSAGASNYAGDQTAFYGYGNDTWRVSDKLTLNYGLRYEFTAVPSGERRQALNALSSVPGLIDFHAPQPQYTNFAPRVGVAYAVNEKTSIRAGFGIAYDVLYDNLGLLTLPPQLSQTHDVGNTGNGDPNFLAPNFLANGGLSSALVPITSQAVARASTAAYLPDQVLPYSENYNLTIQRVFAKNYTAEVQYLGTRGIHLPLQNQTNVRPFVTAANQLTTYFSGPTLVPATATTAAYGLIATPTNVNTYAAQTASTTTSYFDPAFYNAGFRSKITSYQPYGASNYNGLGLNITRRYTNGLQLNASYTFSRAMDNSTADVNASALTQRRAQNSRNEHAEYSRSGLDRNQRATLEAVYDLPFFRHGNFLMRNLVGNWQLSPIYTYETPEYVTATSNLNSNRNGDSGAISRTIVNPNGNKQVGSGVAPVYSTTLAGLCANGATRCNANLVGYQALNANAGYVTAGSGTIPNQERNTLAGRPIDNVTLTAGKRISFTERYSFEFQAQAFNLFNHAQYVPGGVDGIGLTSTTSANTSVIAYLNPANPNFNQPQTVYTNHSRSMQLVAKFNF